jgi:hypothetical protein|tara:strand:+ start:402 stop:938 length:537 start_codon:yes stop_codon:yes gene_type:complete
MEIHIVVSILLDYHQDFEHWISARTVCRTCKKIVDKRSYNNGTFGRRTFLKQNECMVCERTNPDVKWLHYCSDTPASQRWISHCRSWPCRASALYSMVSDYKQDNVHVLRKALGIASDLNIPRSDGSVSKGFFRQGCVIKQDDKWYVSTEWTTKGSDHYTKLVPLSYYTQDEPKLMFD